MRILIADDEELTRNGIISSIDWAQFGITELDSADDGVNALALIRRQPPDILLTYVRMPRMDGIELSRQLRELAPDCPVIFMSGYSDKEYLKAAISLKAVSYVEKPFDPDEIRQALSDAVALVQKQLREEESNRFFLLETHSKLALALTQPSPRLSDEMYRTLPAGSYFTTLILHVGDQLLQLADDTRSTFFAEIDRYLDSLHLKELHTLKYSAYVILHLYGTREPSERTLRDVCEFVRTLLEKTGIAQFHLTLGETVKGRHLVYNSYNSAVLLQQSAFFTDYASILMPCADTEGLSSEQLNTYAVQFRRTLAEKDRAQALDFCGTLHTLLKNNRGLLPNQARDLYYKLLTALSNLQYEAKVSNPSDKAMQNPLEEISCCTIYEDLHALLVQAVNSCFDLLDNASAESPTLFLIKDYINSNDRDCALSIKDISEHVHLSSSYLCTVFKTETGQTLNQYLTNFRMEKAKQLLSDPRNRVTDIAARVGYADCNYFGKTFKKIVGLSPSEYREKESLNG